MEDGPTCWAAQETDDDSATTPAVDRVSRGALENVQEVGDIARTTLEVAGLQPPGTAIALVLGTTGPLETRAREQQGETGARGQRGEAGLWDSRGRLGLQDRRRLGLREWRLRRSLLGLSRGAG